MRVDCQLHTPRHPSEDEFGISNACSSVKARQSHYVQTMSRGLASKVSGRTWMGSVPPAVAGGCVAVRRVLIR